MIRQLVNISNIFSRFRGGAIREPNRLPNKQI